LGTVSEPQIEAGICDVANQIDTYTGPFRPEVCHDPPVFGAGVERESALFCAAV